ncbi:hypothetical protein HRI_000876300 [Hibiscus trionum]|uniref:C2 domain-containing protein n=1 Tax=Hibiscus trionum TaxID=183268 RepID=A0A9W7HA31_HIBTR|nr:hypothetical protein HRI_000876300 [Hibiscus trionum]
MSDLKTPFHLLELHVISAQDLEPICRRRKMQTYAVVWIYSKKKRSTGIDTRGHTNPSWNDKFVFRIDKDFLYRDTSAITIEIYAVHWFRHIHVGTVRAIIGNLIPHITFRSSRSEEVQLGTTFVALQIWRPSGRPQGILNIGLTLIDSSKRSMPLYLQMGSSAIRYKHLIGEEEYPVSSTGKSNNNENPSPLPDAFGKPKLRRTKSDSSSIFPSALQPKKPAIGSSVINAGGSIVNGGGSIVNGGGSIVNGGGSMVNCTLGKINSAKGKSSSIVNGMETVGNSMVNFVVARRNSRKEKSGSVVNGGSMVNYSVAKLNPRKGKSGSVVNGLEDPGTKSKRGKSKSGSVVNGGAKVWSDSELGPSPSEVAATMAKNMHHNKFDDCESSILGWSLDEDSLEGFRSKLEQWRNEEPPVYDWSSDTSNSFSGTSSSKRSRHARRHSDNSGSFKCFGNICGCQFTISCGGGGGGEDTGKRNGNLHRAPSSSIYDDMSYV